VPHVRLTCPGLPWGVRGPKMMGAAQRLLYYSARSACIGSTLEALAGNHTASSVASDFTRRLLSSNRSPVPAQKLKDT
jgi:hypothetical protein